MAALAAGFEALKGHLWTVLPTARDFVLRPLLPAQQRVAIPVHDDRFGPTSLSASLATPPGAEDVVVLVHGLGGHRRCAYVQRAARILHELGFATLALDLRGADHRGGGFYHVAMTEDLVAACRWSPLQRFRRVFVLGFSMGGHLAVHFAASTHEPRLRGVAALCTPLDLATAQRHLDARRNGLYRHYVLQGLKAIYGAVATRHAVPTPAAQVRNCRTFLEWDRMTIAPRYGFDSAEASYEALSARRVLPALRTDTVLVLARSDPIITPIQVLPHIGLAPAGKLHVTVLPRGGHLQFPDGQDLGLGHADSGSVVAQLAAYWRTM